MCEDIDWIRLAQERINWLTFVSTMTWLRDAHKAGILADRHQLLEGLRGTSLSRWWERLTSGDKIHIAAKVVRGPRESFQTKQTNS